MQGLNPITMQCTYATPCGWCTKWDKKCNEAIGPKPKTKCVPEVPCLDCINFNQAPTPDCCKKCNQQNNYKYYIRMRVESKYD